MRYLRILNMIVGVNILDILHHIFIIDQNQIFAICQSTLLPLRCLFVLLDGWSLVLISFQMFILLQSDRLQIVSMQGGSTFQGLLVVSLMQLFIDILCDMLILTVGSVVVLDGLFAVVDDLIRGEVTLVESKSMLSQHFQQCNIQTNIKIRAIIDQLQIYILIYLMPSLVYPYYCYCYQYLFKFIPSLSRLRLLQIFPFLIKIIKSALQMDILYNNTLINSIVDKLFKHRRVHYSEYHLDDLLQGLNIKHEISEVINANYEQIYTSLFTKGQAKPQYCIVYMHGYGSNRLECVNVLRYLPQNYALCSFDFSGCGKSQGDLVTYGMKEKEDIHFILNFLKGRGFKRFILWGRSMGATSALLYSIKYKPSNIILLVLDSPFHSFQSIAFDIANKNMNLPEFLISFGLGMAKKNCIQFQHNPFKIQLNNIHEITIPSVFVYSQQDSVINSHNTYLLCSKYKAKFEKLVINQDHNTIRSEVTVNKILQLIEKYDKRDRINLPLSYNQASNSRPFVFQYQNTPIREKILKKEDSNETRIQFYSKKGIQRVSQLIKTEKKKIVYEISDQIMKDSTLQNDFFSSPAPKRANLSLNNLQSSQQFIRKNSTIKTQKRPLKHKNKIGLSGGLYQTSAQNNSQKNMNKKINVVQSSKYNSCKISTIIK